MINEEKLKALLEILKDTEEYCGVIKEPEATNQNDCKTFSYDVEGFAINLAQTIYKLNDTVFKSGTILNSKCDGVIVCSNGKIVLVELKTNILNKCKKALNQIVASYISLCALLYIFSLDIRNFKVEIIIAGCKRKQHDPTRKKKGYKEEREILKLCKELVDKGFLIIKCFPEDILELSKLSKNIGLHPDIHKSNVPVYYHICDNCRDKN